MDPSEIVAAAVASAHNCGACGQSFPDGQLRDFFGVPVCVECYRELGLLTIGELSADPDEGLLARLLSVDTAEVPAGPRGRFGALERFASRLDPAGAEQLIVSAARGGTATGMQEVMWVLLAADALLRAGGRSGARPLEGREMSLLLNLAARVGMDIAWASMLDVGVASRSPEPRGEEWLYEDLVAPGGGSLVGLSQEKQAFARYIRGLKVKVDLVAEDVRGRRDEVDIPLAILARIADEVLAAFEHMESGKGAGRRAA